MRRVEGASPRAWAVVVFLGALLAPTAGHAQKVSLKWDDRFGFADVERYAWQPAQAGGCPQDVWLPTTNAVDARLKESGLVRVEPDADPGLFVSCHVSGSEVRELRPAEVGLSSGGDGSIGVLVAPRYERGTLALEFRRPDGRLVFIGVAEGAVDAPPEEIQARIDRAVERISEGFHRRIELSEPDFSRYQGRPVTAIELNGYRITKEYVIRREIHLAVGEPFDEQTLAADRVRLENLNISVPAALMGEGRQIRALDSRDRSGRAASTATRKVWR